MKKTFFTFFLITILLGAGMQPILAQTPKSAVEYMGDNMDMTAGAGQLGEPTRDLRVIIAEIIGYALGFLGIILTILIIYGGFLWMTAGGNEQQIEKAKKILTNSIIGILIIILAYAFSNWIFGIFERVQ